MENKFYSSIFASLFGTILSHPIDTLKTNQQISGLKVFDVVKKINMNSINKKELIRNYYRGIKYPLMFVPIEKGIVFNMDNYLYNKLNNRIYSGLCSGIVAGFFVNFIENLKINQQNLYNKNNIKLSFNKLLTKGLGQTLIREGIGYTIYFKTFHDYYNPILPTFVAGGLAGMSAWLVIYPFDRIKTMVQSGTSLDGLRLNNIYRGCGLSLFRAMLMHGTVFYMIDQINKI